LGNRSRSACRSFAIDGTEKPRGDAEKAFASAAVRLEAEYVIPTEHHNPMELFASTAIWEDGQLVVYDKTQGVQNVQQYLCKVFELQPGAIRVMSPYMGGGFGAGLRPQYQVVLAVLGAQALKRPVRVMLTRAQMYALGYRPASIERLALGASSGGTLQSMQHDCTAVTSQVEEFARHGAAVRARAFADKAAMIAACHAEPAFDVALVKGSRSAGMEEIVAALCSDSTMNGGSH